MSINLFVAGSNVHQNFVNSEKDLKAQATFKKAVVSTGTWILYTYANYNAAQAGGSPSNYKVLRKGNEEDISSVNGSLYLVEDATEGFILFEHFYYGGFRQFSRQDIPDVMKAFPNFNSGVSSAINLSSDEQFLMYNKANYDGLEGTLVRDKWCPTPSDMGFPNDALRSIRKE